MKSSPISMLEDLRVVNKFLGCQGWMFSELQSKLVPKSLEPSARLPSQVPSVRPADLRANGWSVGYHEPTVYALGISLRDLRPGAELWVAFRKFGVGGRIVLHQLTEILWVVPLK